MKGKIIVLDGVDASGKATQAKILVEKLLKKGCKAKLVSFPDYNSPSSALVKMYLNGEFGSNPEEINPKAISACYALDRFASTFKWKKFYESGGILVMDRYTSSNMIHQAAKIANEKEKEAFLKWLYDFEYNILEIPKPDKVLFLEMPPEVSEKLLAERKENKSATKDIHEKDKKFLEDSYKNAIFVSDFYGWKTIHCAIQCNDGLKPKNISDISNEIWNILFS